MSPAERICTPLNSDVPPAREGEFRPLNIGRLRLDTPVVLAPMAGVTNYPFRSLCREHGAGLYVSEMITARGFLLGNRLTTKLAAVHPDERPRSIQIYGSDPKDLGQMVQRLVDEGIDHIDINFGCPVPKVTRQGGGSAIPAKPRLLARLVRAMVANAQDVPVTVKMRIGLDPETLTYLDAGRAAQEEGAAAVGLHARTAAQLYSGDADWDAIGNLKQALDVPVLGNGDVFECWDALRMMRETGCDGVIVGRGCLGRPWLFGEFVSVFAGQEPASPPNLGGVLEVMEEHGRRLEDLFGEELGVRQMRKWTSWYLRGFRGAAGVRAQLSRLAAFDEMRPLITPLGLDQPFPLQALRASRAKGSRTQRVKLPEGYLDNRDDDTPPKGPHTADEIRAWEKALGAG
ncbi:MAG: tRNA dihydrouridine synthase DusB [Planctomycetota bacterium]|nr:tRNA dihydrouridine synthase DusB [Planctomycetota bacterium]